MSAFLRNRTLFNAFEAIPWPLKKHRRFSSHIVAIQVALSLFRLYRSSWKCIFSFFRYAVAFQFVSALFKLFRRLKAISSLLNMHLRVSSYTSLFKLCSDLSSYIVGVQITSSGLPLRTKLTASSLFCFKTVSSFSKYIGFSKHRCSRDPDFVSTQTFRVAEMWILSTQTFGRENEMYTK